MASSQNNDLKFPVFYPPLPPKQAPSHYSPSPPNAKPPQNSPSPPKVAPQYSPINPRPSPFPAPSTPSNHYHKTPPSPFVNPPPHHSPPPVPKPPRPSPPPPHPFSPSPPPAPGHHSTVIVVVFVSLGGLFLLAFLSVALCCFIKKRRKRVEQKVEIINFDQHVKVHEDSVQGPHGEKVKILTIEEDLHVDEEIKSEKVMEGSHVKSAHDHPQAIEIAKSSGSTSQNRDQNV